MTAASPLANSWTGHMVARYHANPRFAHLGQTTAAHSHGVASIIALLHPQASAALLKAALFHDLGERITGDIPHPAKAAHPAFARALSDLERRAMIDLIGSDPLACLDAVDHQWLKLADRLEAILFCAWHDPASLARPDWAGSVAALIAQAADLGVADPVQAAIAAIAA